MKSVKIILILFTSLILNLSAYGNSFNLPVPIGAIEKAYLRYKDADTVTISEGYGECSGFYWEIPIPVDLDITPPTSQDFIYIFIDHSASNYPSVSIISSTTEPSYSASRLGWYNGEDRCIGAVYTESGTPTIRSFNAHETKVFFPGIQILTNGATSGGYLNTDIDTNTLTPVFAKSLYLTSQSWDANDHTVHRVRSFSYPHSHYTARAYHACEATNWLTTGTSNRKVLYKADDNNDDRVDIWLLGYEFER